MSESVATEFLNLIRLAGLPINERRKLRSDCSSDVEWSMPAPAESVRGQRTGQGTINIHVPSGQCMAIVEIDVMNIDLSQVNTVAITNATDSQIQNAQPLEFAINGPVLYVFRAGLATFTFVFTAQPWAPSGLAQVRGYFLPAEAVSRLSRFSTKLVT